MNGNSLVKGKPWRLILMFSLPIFITLLFQQLYNTVDTIVVGNFAGEKALSAVGTTGSLTFMLLAIASGFSSGAGVQVAQYFGAGDLKKVRESSATSILLLLILGIGTTIFGLLISRPAIIGLMAVPESFSDMAISYFNIYCIGLIFQFGYNIIAAILRSIGDSKASMYFLLIAAIANIFLDLLLVGGFKMGPSGAAIATNISQFGAFLAALIYMYRRYPVFHFKKEDWTLNREYARQCLVLGLPIVLQLMIASVGIIFIQRAVNGYGQAMTASFTVASRVETYVQIPLNSFQTAMATYVAQNVGAKRMDRVHTGTKQVVILSLIVTSIIAALTVLFTPQIIKLFGISVEATAYCTQHIRITAIALVLQAAYIPVFGVFQGTGDGFAVMCTAIIALAIRVFCTYTLCYIPAMDYRIIWWNMIFGFAGGFAITWFHYIRGSWQNKLVLVKV
ncbi:MATE family efflux transporter [Streptococcus equinus]|uniref:MATE family efflux transporter n=1 Tax=Streptococcus equinus TaxID=1335 RepID=UPI003BF89931